MFESPLSNVSQIKWFIISFSKILFFILISIEVSFQNLVVLECLCRTLTAFHSAVALHTQYLKANFVHISHTYYVLRMREREQYQI